MKTIKEMAKGLLKVSFAASLIFFTSCKKQAIEPTAPAATGVIAVHLHTNVNGAEADSGAVVKDAMGRNIKLSIAQFYISGIVLKKTDGSNISLSACVLKTIGEEMYILGTVPSGNYSSISFNVGLSDATNHTMPTSYSAGNPLSIQTPSMWFGSITQGYIFMNLQGMVDTSAMQNSPESDYMPVCYQLGTNSMLKSVSMPSMAQPVSVTARSTQSSPAMIHVMCDYGILLEGVDFKTESLGTPFNYPTVAGKVADKVVNMFSYN